MATSNSISRADIAYYPNRAKEYSGYHKKGFRRSIRSAAASRSELRKAKTQASENAVIAFFSLIGGGIADSFYIMGVILNYLRVAVFVRQERRLYWQMKKLGIRLSYIMGQVKTGLTLPFVKTAAGFRLMGQAVRAKRGQSFGAKFMAVADVFYYGCRNNINIFKTMANYILPVMGVALFLCVITMAGKLSMAVSVTYNGEQLGYVQSEAIAEEAKQIVTGRLVFLNDSERDLVEIQPSYSLDIIQNESMMNEYQLADKIISLSGDEMVTAKGLYVNDVFYGACEGNGTELETALQTLLDSFRSGDKDETVSFVDDVQVIPGVYVVNNIVSADSLVSQIQSRDTSEAYYTVSADETAGEVAEVNNISVDELKELNPDAGIKTAKTTLEEGQKVAVAEYDSFLPVQVIRTETYKEEVDFKTTTTKSAEYVKGTVKTLKAGKKGENEVTAKVSYVDGEEVSREVVSTKVITEPVDREIVQGTATPVSASGSTGDGKINSGFIWPLSGNAYVSSGYGSRSMGYHGGVDICLRGGTYGASVRAVASGTVIYSGYMGSYGKLVKIDHGNGLQTYYGHNSQLLVSVGDTVAQGETIAKAGATGRVTGPHVHLEVRVNGSRRNPMNYLP
ncbi:M23 family metallopeptidase [Massiliimalia massiliensis]|uniref:M23 family metallopeptidase n=1 Tax=Massiliimalia massiliensis TaxID=1852384 RepID=UPI0013563EC6|nr:M23 family metallopeptidase [Massiliimalia massiliensis]